MARRQFYRDFFRTFRRGEDERGRTAHSPSLPWKEVKIAPKQDKGTREKQAKRKTEMMASLATAAFIHEGCQPYSLFPACLDHQFLCGQWQRVAVWSWLGYCALMPMKQHPMPLPRIYLPVETAARELDAKLLLALFLQCEGFPVVIGSHAQLHNTIHHHPPGIYIAHLFDHKKRRIFRILRDLGHVIAAWDEEGLVWLSPEVYRRRRVDATALSHVSRVYAWGRQQAEVLAPVTSKTGTAVCITGNPRQDLYAPALRAMHKEVAAALRARYGAFILINSNFGWINHARSTNPGIEKSEEELKAIATESRHPLGYIHFRYRMFHHFCTLVPTLARRFPERNIIIRPHPSENREVWGTVGHGLDNVHVIYEHRLAPWLLAAGHILHNGCTTAVEAALLGRIPIEFRPEENPDFESPQPAAVSAPARDIRDVERYIESPDALEHLRPRVEQALSGMVERWNDGLASQRIAKDLTAFAARQPSLTLSAPHSLAGQMRARMRAAEKWFLARFVKSSSSNPAYIRQKFPPTEEAAISGRLQRFAALLGIDAPHVRTLDANIWLISPAEAENNGTEE